MVCAPGGEGTKALINQSVLEALGAEGILINISRGSVVDEDALIAALEITPSPVLRWMSLPTSRTFPYRCRSATTW